jgi:hypothetical protein
MLRVLICGLPAIAAGLFGGWIYLAATSVEAEPTTAPAMASPSLAFPAAPAGVPSAAPRVSAAYAPAPVSESEPAPAPAAAPLVDPAPEEVRHRNRRKQIARRLASRDATAGRRDDDDDDD